MPRMRTVPGPSTASHPQINFSYLKGVFEGEGNLRMHVCACLHGFMFAVCMYLWRPEKSFRYPGTGVTGGCETSDAGH